uniref:Uncharacterized protein n=1 Tax=Anopheles maculatus TaxID=74869 RepID=A0A182SZ66_9DIPT
MPDYVAIVITTGVVCFLIFWMIRCCCTRRTQGTIITTPVVITSEVHRVAPATTTVQIGTIVQGHPTGTSAYPAYPPQHPAPYPAQPYMQHYPLQTSAAPPAVPPHQQPAPVQFPALPVTMQYPPPTATTAPPGAPAAPMFNPPSYDQVVAGSYPAQAPYNPDFKG